MKQKTEILADRAGDKFLDKLNLGEDDLKDLDGKNVDEIKELPCTMDQKRKIRIYLQKQFGLRSSKNEKTKWQNFKIGVGIGITKTREILYTMKLWERSIYEVEGRFGSAIKAYFAFLRWLLALNIGIFIIVGCFVILPSALYLAYGDRDDRVNSTECGYEPYNANELNSFQQYGIWWFTGGGFMENTYFFMGFYENTSALPLTYSIPLVYILTAIGYFLFSLIAVVHRTAVGIRDSLISDEDRYYEFCNLVFAGWDFCVQEKEFANIKHLSLYNDVKESVAEQVMKNERKKRSKRQKAKLYLKRFFINIICTLILYGSFYAIFYTANYAITNSGTYQDDIYVDAIVTYGVSVVITSINLIAPIVFRQLVKKEEYSPEFTIKFTLVRVVLLRLSSLIFLYTVVYIQVNCDVKQGICPHCSGIQCWETYLGQEMYKLVILDFFIIVIVTLCVEFPRRIFVDIYYDKYSIARKVGYQQFNLTQRVINLVYNQTISWIGAFYAPLLPLIVIAKLFVVFYLQRLSLFYNCQPSSSFRANRTSTFFYVILLFGYLTAIFPVAVGIILLEPSLACGPFRGRDHMFDIIIDSINNTNDYVKNLFYILGSVPLAMLVILALIVIIYFYWALEEAYRRMVKLLREQLVMEGMDKQFLLARATDLRQQLLDNGIEPMKSLSVTGNSLMDNPSELEAASEGE